MDDKTRKEAFLSLARALKSVSQACHMLGISRNTYYRAINEEREDGKNEPKRRKYSDETLAKMREMENRVIEVRRNDPHLGKRAIAKKIQEAGIYISASGVYNILRRKDLEMHADALNRPVENKPRPIKNPSFDGKSQSDSSGLDSALYHK